MLTTTEQGKYPTDKSEYDNRNIHQIPIMCVQGIIDFFVVVAPLKVLQELGFSELKGQPH